MSTLIRSALIALALATSVSAAMAQTARDPNWVSKSDPYGGYNPNSPEGNRAFWDYQNRHGN